MIELARCSPGRSIPNRVEFLLVVSLLASCGSNDLDTLPSVPLEAIAEMQDDCLGTLADESACVRAVYFWTAAMPLSVLGAREIAVATDSLGIPLSLVNAGRLAESPESMRAESLRDALLTAGAGLHYPSIVLFSGPQPVGDALLGYRQAETYRRLISNRRIETGVGSEARPKAVEAPYEPMSTVWTHALNSSPGAFFRHVPGTSSIAFDRSGVALVLDMVTGETFEAPGWVDFVPSPDGRFFVTPSRDNDGLAFFDANTVLRVGRNSGSAAQVPPTYKDREMTDQYPSVGLLAAGASEQRRRYRIVLSWVQGVSVRDYDVDWSSEGMVVSPATPKRTLCGKLDLSIPMLSRDGLELAAREEASGTTKIFRLEPEGGCEEVFDFRMATGKVAFSGDGSLLAFSAASSIRSAGTPLYILRRSDRTTSIIDSGVVAPLVIPEFVDSEGILVVTDESRFRQFKLLCCASGAYRPLVGPARRGTYGSPPASLRR